MKKIAAILLVTILTISLGSCGNKGGGQGANDGQEVNIKDSLELLNTVWNSYTEEEKFPAAGGDMTEENMTMDGPGRFSIEDGAMLDSTLGFPAAALSKIDDAASLMHMMNANTFTCGVFRVKDSGSISSLTDAVKENIMNRQWMCGFPEKLVIITVGDYVISFFGDGGITDTFKEKVSAAYEGAQIVCEEPIV